ncbi:hypothetical protein [Pleomorphovibrio marinus]|uniref:hypothetical protein n=1 Tax=Pleomorphovibrio marinus TaxID=2164132 RepID=UPI0013006BEB|nr:hypothetical protein [Pleomorphovibrio marinus]
MYNKELIEVKKNMVHINVYQGRDEKVEIEIPEMDWNTFDTIKIDLKENLDMQSEAVKSYDLDTGLTRSVESPTVLVWEIDHEPLISMSSKFWDIKAVKDGKPHTFFPGKLNIFKTNTNHATDNS